MSGIGFVGFAGIVGGGVGKRRMGSSKRGLRRLGNGSGRRRRRRGGRGGGGSCCIGSCGGFISEWFLRREGGEYGLGLRGGGRKVWKGGRYGIRHFSLYLG